MKKILLLLALLWLVPTYSQMNDNDLKIFIDCSYYCDMTHIKQNLKNVEFVRDQKFADVHLLFLVQRNGGGGRHFEIDFSGQNQYKELNDKVSFSTKEDTTESELQDLVLKNIKLGLVRYWLKSGSTDNLDLSFKSNHDTPKNNTVEDPWNKWVFSLGLHGYFNGQETNSSSSLNANISVKQITEKNKFYLAAYLDNSKDKFSFEDEEIISNSESISLNVYDVISLNNHWSVGIFGNVRKSTYWNYKFSGTLKPAIEYNFFDYKDSSKKQLTLAYQIGGVKNKYEEKTIFEKTEEFLWEHELSLGGSIRQKWGNINSQISYSSYLHDTQLRAFNFYLRTNLRLVKGFTFNVSGRYRITDNQINIPAGNITLEEILLRQQQVKSGYNYYFSVGLSYSFGSIYNTVVNPRFNF